MPCLSVLLTPVPESFNTALCVAAMDAARARGHDVRLIDLHAEGSTRSWPPTNAGATPKTTRSQPTSNPMSPRCNG